MNYLLDTCILSDGAKPAHFPRLVEWLGSVPEADCAVSVLSLGELRFGIERLPRGRKREGLKRWLEDALWPRFADRALPVDERVASAWALLRAQGDDLGRPLPLIDGFLLATARTHGLTLVTRNLRDVDGRGVEVLAPY